MKTAAETRNLFIIILLTCSFAIYASSDQLEMTEEHAIGIVKGFSLGFDLHSTIGVKGKSNQSPYGGTLLFLNQTTSRSQVRLSTGIPMFRSEQIKDLVKDKPQDFYASIDHEWGFKYFAVAVGLAMNYMHGFDTTSFDSVFSYKSSALYNIALSIRAGRPWSGFRGRITWPLFGGRDLNQPQNYFFEYSAYGFFGNRRIKTGFGVNGTIRSWGHMFTENDDDYYYDFDYEPEPPEVREFQAVLPGIKTAFLLNKHNSITISAELGGIILPRFGTYWAPEIGLVYVFSFGELTDPGSLDGKF